jgi:alcohol dehydrogenase YqhD (iron-dependent ADH family)
MAAKVALVDPELTYTVPLRTAAATGVDALTHALEAHTVTCSAPSVRQPRFTPSLVRCGIVLSLCDRLSK